MPLKSLAIEAFDIHGRYYTYFGLWPSIVRMPVLLVTHHFDGRLTAPSMLLALAVTLVSTARLHWALRTIIRRDVPLGRAETLSVGAIQFLVGAGSVVIFLGSRPLVYHEMEIWGVATGLLTADCLCRYAMRPSIRRAIAVGLAATIAAMSRPSVGFGAIAAVGLLALVELIELTGWLRRPSDDDQPHDDDDGEPRHTRRAAVVARGRARGNRSRAAGRRVRGDQRGPIRHAVLAATQPPGVHVRRPPAPDHPGRERWQPVRNQVRAHDTVPVRAARRDSPHVALPVRRLPAAACPRVRACHLRHPRPILERHREHARVAAARDRRHGVPRASSRLACAAVSRRRRSGLPPARCS